ncbi:hypothetical protein [Sphingomonas adhaesiva]|uniref:hypothetical protein n=1 Tax=Sphingomonas adhaesiva TaxID=28212 RepID=UPI002FFB598D
MSARRVRIGAVWDSSVEVLRGRAGILATLAAIYLILPAVVPAVLALANGGALPAGLGALLSLAQLALVVVALLGIAAVASDPATDRSHAQAIGWRRLGAGLLATIAIGLLFAVALIPLAFAAAASGLRIDEASGALDLRAASTAGLGGVTLLSLLLGVVALWASARLLLVIPVIANEPLSLGALRRSVALTRGAGLRLVGVALLYVIVVGVASAAATSVTGVVARLLLGQGAATVAIAIVGGLVSAGTAVLQGVFAARFYVAARDMAA